MIEFIDESKEKLDEEIKRVKRVREIYEEEDGEKEKLPLPAHKATSLLAHLVGTSENTISAENTS